MIRHALGSTPVRAGLLLLGVLLTACEAPPPQTAQQGYRGTAMEAVDNPATVARVRAAQTVPAPLPPVPAGGPKASAIYKNVQVLGDLNVASFTRVMNAMTSWVAPKQGCAYCHNLANLADDTLYTKVVARRMLQMTRDINTTGTAHVGVTGVTCYTCHRGNNVPQYTWTKLQEEDRVFAGWRAGQNAPDSVARYASLPQDPFTGFLDGPGVIRVNATTALPAGTSTRNIKDTEKTYSLMMHLTEALGVNCTFCHNSRSFASWEGPTTRVTAWHGIRLVRRLNGEYIGPLATVLPAHRLGAGGDAPKANCATCHQGVNKPLNGVSMLADYPELRGAQP